MDEKEKQFVYLYINFRVYTYHTRVCAAKCVLYVKGNKFLLTDFRRVRYTNDNLNNFSFFLFT